MEDTHEQDLNYTDKASLDTSLHYTNRPRNITVKGRHKLMDFTLNRRKLLALGTSLGLFAITSPVIKSILRSDQQQYSAEAEAFLNHNTAEQNSHPVIPTPTVVETQPPIPKPDRRPTVTLETQPVAFHLDLDNKKLVLSALPDQYLIFFLRT